MLCLIHQSISKRDPPQGNPRGFAPIFSPSPRDLYHLNCPGVGPIIKVPSCQLMPHEVTFQLQTDLPSIAPLWLQNLFQSWGETLKLLSMVLKLKLEGMTRINWTAFQLFSRFDFCKIPKFRRRLTGKAD